MKKINYSSSIKIGELRNTSASSDISTVAREIMDTVRTTGDVGLRTFADKFDRAKGTPLRIVGSELLRSATELPLDLRRAIDVAIENITTYHTCQVRKTFSVETFPGIECGQLIRPIQRLGVYIPAGTAPLFSTLLMLLIPATLAGVPSIAVTTPCGATVPPAIAYILDKFNVTEVYRIGGAQAIAAMAFGTETIQKVDKIVGPGNGFVNAAKKLVAAEGIAIDLPAGPSDLLIIADDSASARYAAADLISQAEHGTDSLVVLVSASVQLLTDVERELENQLAKLPRGEIAAKALANSLLVTVESLDQAIEFANRFGPEHLSLQCSDAASYLGQVISAGSIFIGPDSAGSLGDYISGPNHVLPTDGASAGFSGVTVTTFQKTISWQRASRQGIQNLGPLGAVLARAEGLEGHARAIEARIEK